MSTATAPVTACDSPPAPSDATGASWMNKSELETAGTGRGNSLAGQVPSPVTAQMQRAAHPAWSAGADCHGLFDAACVRWAANHAADRVVVLDGPSEMRKPLSFRPRSSQLAIRTSAIRRFRPIFGSNRMIGIC